MNKVYFYNDQSTRCWLETFTDFFFLQLTTAGRVYLHQIRAYKHCNMNGQKWYEAKERETPW